MENSREVPQKLKTELSYDPAIPLLDLYLEKRKTPIWKDTRIPVFIAALTEATEVSVNSWMDKEKVVYIHNGILLNHEREWNIAIYSNMDGPRDYHSEWSKSDRERQMSWYHLYVESKKCTNELI